MKHGRDPARDIIFSDILPEAFRLEFTNQETVQRIDLRKDQGSNFEKSA